MRKNPIGKPEIIEVLRDYPETRSSDDLLCRILLHKHKLWIMDIHFVKFVLTVVKTRQRLQLLGQYLADPKVVEKRRIYAMQMRGEMSQSKREAQDKAYFNFLQDTPGKN